MGFVLLIAFINTIVFPTHALVHQYVKTASLDCNSPSSANLVEYIVEDYLDVPHLPVDAEDADVHDMEISLEDFDFLCHIHIVKLQAPLQARPIYQYCPDYRLFNSCRTLTTPPPEAYICVLYS